MVLRGSNNRNDTYSFGPNTIVFLLLASKQGENSILKIQTQRGCRITRAGVRRYMAGDRVAELYRDRKATDGRNVRCVFVLFVGWLVCFVLVWLVLLCFALLCFVLVCSRLPKAFSCSGVLGTASGGYHLPAFGLSRFQSQSSIQLSILKNHPLQRKLTSFPSVCIFRFELGFCLFVLLGFLGGPFERDSSFSRGPESLVNQWRNLGSVKYRVWACKPRRTGGCGNPQVR